MIKTSTLFFITILICFSLLDVLFTYSFKKGTFFKTQWIYNLKNKQLDYAVLGASRSLTAIDIGETNEVLGLVGLNLSLDGSLPTSQYLILKLFLEHGNKIDQLIFNVNTWQIGIDSISHFSYPRFMPYAHDDAVYDYFKTYDDNWIYYRYVPFYRYAKFNFDWGLGMYANSVFGMFKPNFDSLGSFYYPFYDYRGTREIDDYAFDLTGDFKNLFKIHDLCKQYGIKLTVIFLPVVNLRYDEGYKDNMQQFEAMLAAKQIGFIDYGNAYNGQFALFTDETHFNKKGVKQFTNDYFIPLVDSLSH
ncbi:MAG: hypothetical protein HC819_23075 [Cyclobacteriaceae bacterium]|nr:hypothetical protein [Cyclobacteriaceae bacterium]